MTSSRHTVCAIVGRGVLAGGAIGLVAPFSLRAYSTGSTSSVSSVAVTRPPITTVARGRCTSAPAEVASAIGRKPREATVAVISTGRSRTSVPLRMRS